ncbi:nucleotidyl transferase AbiEii/AbiGii toxin family protein [Thalassospira mesophila]|uniref:nucleotidyl transferase AbiEii/AbiGii toxin family protein n=1 Tax=Thalassospira mesophila TaxID=1293891 RepID=UPI000A1DA9D5|nr:nucleotidyl transferase AbiEii/AbiGii toxin family protein [Thalassospira mesophila]
MINGPFSHNHHNKIHYVLSFLRDDFFADNAILFCGGTMLALTHGEYRRSDDIDFVPDPQKNGYRTLRNMIGSFGSHAAVLFKSLPDDIALGEARSDQYGIRFGIQIGDTSEPENFPIKFEIFQESRLSSFSPAIFYKNIPVPCLSDLDLTVQKLLANTDRGGDSSLNNRDLYDLAILTDTSLNLGKAIRIANNAYDVEKALDLSLKRVENSKIRKKNFLDLDIAPKFWHTVEEGINRLRRSRTMEPLTNPLYQDLID